MKEAEPLVATVAAHRAAIDSQKAMRDAAVVRGEAVRAARAAGYSWREIAEALREVTPNLTTQRVIAMSKQ